MKKILFFIIPIIIGMSIATLFVICNKDSNVTQVKKASKITTTTKKAEIQNTNDEEIGTTTNNSSKNTTTSSNNKTKVITTKRNVVTTKQNTTTRVYTTRATITTTTKSCNPNKFAFSWFVGDYNSLNECLNAGNNVIQKDINKYSFNCSDMQNECGETEYMLIIQDDTGKTYRPSQIQ